MESVNDKVVAVCFAGIVHVRYTSGVMKCFRRTGSYVCACTSTSGVPDVVDAWVVRCFGV